MKEHIALGKVTQNDKYQDISGLRGLSFKDEKVIFFSFEVKISSYQRRKRWDGSKLSRETVELWLPRLLKNKALPHKYIAKVSFKDKHNTCSDEHAVIYGRVESLYCAPETNITLYVK